MTRRSEASRAELNDLRELARACGVVTSFTDATGVRRKASPETLVAVLAMLGEPVRRAGDARAALRARRLRRDDPALEPVLVAWNGRAKPVPLPGRDHRSPARWSVLLEQGGEIQADARTRVELPELPMGIHSLRISANGVEHEATILSAPTRCYRGEDETVRELGLLLPLYALNSAGAMGVGDLSDFASLGEWAGLLGCRHLGTLPLLASFLDEPFEPSPYSPVSRLFWNELFVDVEAAPELAASPRARRLLASPAYRRRVARARDQRLVDYHEAMAMKKLVLDALAEAAFAHDSFRMAIDASARNDPHLKDYARFRAVTEARGSTWPSWPARLREGRVRDGDGDRRAFRRHLYAQHLMRRQMESLDSRLSERGSSLYLDLPLGVNADGYDVWRFRDQFLTGASVGAPPDALFAGGQNWGFPPPDPSATRRAGHAYFAASLRHHLRHAGLLRLDHVMGLHRLYIIPAGFDATQGVYVSSPAEELYAVLAIESHRAQARLVGENLGTVPASVNRELKRRGLLTMSVTQFEFRADARRAIPIPQRESLATLDTHDTPTFAAFWRGNDIVERVKMNLIEPREAKREERDRAKLRTAIMRHLVARGSIADERATLRTILQSVLALLASSECEILLVNLEDLWLEREPQNVPGIADVPNWRRKAARSLEQIISDRSLGRLLQVLAALRRGESERHFSRPHARRSRRGGGALPSKRFIDHRHD